MSRAAAAVRATGIFADQQWEWFDVETDSHYVPGTFAILSTYEALENAIHEHGVDRAETGRLAVTAEFANGEDDSDGVLHTYYVVVGDDLEG